MRLLARALAAVLLSTITSTGLVAAASAQEPAPTGGEVPAAGERTLTLADLGLGEPALRGTDGRLDVFVPRPADAPVDGWQLRLRYRRSELLDPISTLTVLVGGIPLRAIRLDGPIESELVVDVPAAAIGDAGTTFTLAGYLRLRPDACEERDNPAQFVAIDPRSSIVLPGGDEIDLAELGPLLAGPLDPVVELVAGDGADAAAPAAAWLVGRLAAVQGGTPRLGGSDADVRLELAVGGDTPAVAVAGGDVPTVTVTAPTAEALESSLVALADPEVAGALRGTSAVLDPGADRPTPRDPWSDGVARFDELGIGERRLVGPGPRTTFLAIDRPLDVRLAETRLRLALDASGALTDASAVRVAVNGTVVGTRALRPGAHTYDLPVPRAVADRAVDGTPARSLDVAVDAVLDLPDGECRTPDPEAARVTVLGRSAFVVERRATDVTELGRFPSPLDDDPLVLHDGTRDARVAALQIAAAYGRWAPTGAPPEIAAADAVGADALRERDLVLLGDAVDVVLPDPPAVRAAVRGDDDVDAALAVTTAPGGRDHQALLVRGDVLDAARLLSSREDVAGLSGRAAALDGGEVQVVVPVASEALPSDDAAPPNGEQAAATSGPQPDERSWVLPSMVILAVLVLTALAVIRYRWFPVRR